jgi:transposase InsO family protein
MRAMCGQAVGADARLGRPTAEHDLPIAPNLLGRSFTAEQPEAVWLADVSYVPTDQRCFICTVSVARKKVAFMIFTYKIKDSERQRHLWSRLNNSDLS